MQNSTLSDFEPDKIQKRNTEQQEDQKVMNLLSRFTAEMLKDALINNGGHPLPEWGEGETWRYYYQEECERRGKRLLEQLGWPADEDSLYVNLHTGDVETLIDIATSHGYFADRHTIDSQVWSIIEHWEPYDNSKPNKYKIQYLKEEIERLNHILQTGGAKEYMKRTRAELAEKQSLLEAEKSKLKVM